MGGSFRIVKLFGFDIRAHFSWVFIFLLVAYFLARGGDGFLPQTFPGWETRTYWIVGIIASGLLFVCVLIHELSHSLVARYRGHTVRSITLFFLGGVSEIEGESKTAGEEFWIAVVGPLASLLLGAGFILLWQIQSWFPPQIQAIVLYLAFVNIALAIFNMLPAYPMDGGRVLRSLVWRVTGNPARAISVAANTGIVLGLGMIALGVIVFITQPDLRITGLWLVFVGWFLRSSAAASKRQRVTNTALAGKTVRDAMDTRLPLVPPGVTVQELMDHHMGREYQRVYLVLLGDSFQGLVSISDVRRVEMAERGSKFVTEIMTRADRVVTVAPEESLESALQKLGTHDLNQLVVVQEGRPVGLLSRRDLLRVQEVVENLPQ